MAGSRQDIQSVDSSIQPRMHDRGGGSSAFTGHGYGFIRGRRVPEIMLSLFTLLTYLINKKLPFVVVDQRQCIMKGDEM